MGPLSERPDVEAAELRERTEARGDPEVQIDSAWDGKHWKCNQVLMGEQASLAIWARGLMGVPKEDICVRLDGYDLPAVYVGEPDAKGLRQVNAMLPHGIASGVAAVNIAAGDSVSTPVAVKIVRV